MILGIDATNIRGGGGFTHLNEILLNAEPQKYDFEKVVIWSNLKTLNDLPEYDWIKKVSHPLLNKSFIFSFLFQIFMLSKFAKKEKCNLLFVPGGTFLGNFPNILSMSQNMLPFEEDERNRFGSMLRMKFRILFLTQKYTFRKSKGIIFLTNYAKDYISHKISLKNDSTIIPHGINLTFLNTPKPQKTIDNYNYNNPFKLLYVSIVTAYKHQWNVAEAALKLRNEGYPITLDLVGGNNKDSLELLQEVLRKDNYGAINYRGEISHKDISDVYKKADAFVFASSCENMPIILVEAMTAGLPIASSNRGPMPEVLEEGGFYFDPLQVDDIYNAIKEMINNVSLRHTKSKYAYTKSINYTWKDCSARTFAYFSKIAKKNNYANPK